ncbi:uncharacterized protein [Nicotiana tomentosiformis]|uniref:uncharacterized protein n=1 Tax=Nicotiana tomentosiformis TaxID=4098 RepID=UPI00051C4A6F|nr:uncharacterized protein LOC104104672 [Nicotiana tomentosiformis]
MHTLLRFAWTRRSRQFWEDLDEVVYSILHIEKLFIGGNFNRNIRATARGYDDVYAEFGFGDGYKGGTLMLDRDRAFDLVIANSSFPMREEHLVTISNMVARNEIDYFLCRMCDRVYAQIARSS